MITMFKTQISLQNLHVRKRSPFYFLLKSIIFSLILLLFTFKSILAQNYGNYWAGAEAGNGAWNDGLKVNTTFVGIRAGDRITTGDNNAFFGSFSGRYTTSGWNNSFFGHDSGNKNTTGSFNSFFGSGSGFNNTTGRYNSFFGYYSGINNTTGSDNSFFGVRSGFDNTTGKENSFFGRRSGFRNTTGRDNSFFGHSSGFSNTTGNRNLFLGDAAGYSNTTSSNNTYLGFAAGYSSTGANNVFIGLHAGYYETGSNKLYIDNTTTSAPLIWGDFSTHHLKVNGRLETTGDFQLKPGGFIDDDATFGGNNDDWIKLSNYIEMKSSTDSWGLVLRDKDNGASQYFALTQVDGSSYLTEGSSYTNYFIKGTNRDTYFGNHIYGKSVNNGYSNLYKFGGLFFTWEDSNTYGTQHHHSIRSTYGDTYGDNITLNSFNHIRLNLDANNNNGTSYFEIGKNTTHTANILLRLRDSDGHLGIGTADPKKKLHVNGGTIRVETTNGYIDIGSTHSSWGHIITDRPKFYFNKGISVDEGIVSSHNEDLQLQTSGTTRMTLSNTDGNVTVNNNLILGGTLKFLDTQDIRNDNSVDDLLTLQGDGSLGTRSVQSIESPWMWEEIFNGQDTLLMVCPDSAIIGNVFIDVIDLNGNLRVGENAYIDDDVNYGDDGTPDDWMKFNDRIEFRSSDPKHGIVLYDPSSFLHYTNITHDGGTTYFSNNKASDQYFMKATGEDVVFGGNVSFGGLSGAGNFTLNSPTNLYFAIDSDNNSGGAENNAIVFGRNSESGTGANFDELLVINEDGNVGIGNGTDQVTVPAGYRFSVDGKIVVEEIKVELSTAWPDYVFSPTYELMPIQELKSYIRERKHLPNVPSAQEIKDNGGMELGDMNKKLMEKVEELTLYLIDEHDRINAIQEELEALKAENQELRNALAQGR